MLVTAAAWIVVLLGALSTRPSLTTRLTTSSPGRSGVMLARAASGSAIAAALPEGAETIAQRHVSGSPLESVLALPSSATIVKK